MMTSSKGNVSYADASSNSTESFVTQCYSFPQLNFNHMFLCVCVWNCVNSECLEL